MLDQWNAEHAGRLDAMIADKNDTWDLSPNDRAMLISVRAELDRLRKIETAARNMLAPAHAGHAYQVLREALGE